ncbi:hypothetical protein CEXT_735161, partial [Caerostris extrusa]
MFGCWTLDQCTVSDRANTVVILMVVVRKKKYEILNIHMFPDEMLGCWTLDQCTVSDRANTV